MFIILGFLILVASFVIALVSLVREHKQIANVSKKLVPDEPPARPPDGAGPAPREVSSRQEPQPVLPRDEKIGDNVGKPDYPWESQNPKVGEKKVTQKFDRVTISISDLVNLRQKK